MSTFSIFLLFSLFVATAFSDYFLLFSHQAPRDATVEVLLTVNDHDVQEFQEFYYGDYSEYVNITKYQTAGQPGIFNLTVYTQAFPQILLLKGTYDFGNTHYWSYYMVDRLNSTVATSFVNGTNFTAPEQLTGLWRVTNLAPIDVDFDLFINGHKQASFDYESLTDYAAVQAGVYNFQVSLNGTTVAAKNVTIESGEVTTVIFNGIKFGTEETDWALNAELDQDFQGSYNTCFVRVINSVANSNYSTLQPVFVPGWSNPFGTVGYGEVTEYVGVDAGSYRIFFTQEDDTTLTTVYVDLTCEVSAHYTLTYQGVPDSLNPVLKLTGRYLEDQGNVPYYGEAKLRVDLLSTSYTSDVAVFVNGENVETIQYGDLLVPYLSITNETVVLRLVDSASQSQILNQTFSVQFGQTYSYFVLGLYNNTEYPVSGLLQGDSSNIEPSTTTTGGTTGDSDDDDDDDDDLSGGEIAGIVIGVIAGVAILGGLCFWLIRSRRRSQFTTIG